MKSVLITGVDSYIGNSLVSYLHRWPDDYIVDTISLKNDNWKDICLSKYDTIFHVAGIAHSDRGNISPERSALYYKVNTYLAIDIAHKAKLEGVKQFIFMSSASVYGKSVPMGEELTIKQETELNPGNSYGDSKVKAERGIIPLQDENFNVVILRPPMIYGVGCKGNYPILSKIAKKSPVFPVVNNQRSMLYIENLVEFVRLMIDNEEKGIFWPQNEEYTNTSEMVAMIAAAHGKKILLVPGFGWALKIMGRFTGLVDKAFGSLTYDQEMSKYKVPYCKKTLAESIKETEGIL